MIVELLAATSVIAGGQSISWELTVPQKDYSAQVSAEFLIVALVDLPTFKFERQHAEYGDTSFNLQRGDVLANGGHKTFDIEKWYDPLNPPLESFIKIVRKPEATGRLEVSMDDDDVITVLLPTSAHIVLGPRQSLFQSTLIGLTIAPALIHVLEQVHSEEGESAYRGKTWYKSLRTLLKKHGVESDDPIDQVQAILNLPFTHGIVHLHESVNKIESE
jgi:archaellum component FlaF (FlaF/FlaG flagellin family)